MANLIRLITFSIVVFSLNVIAESPTPYGLPINLEQAKIVAAGAQAEAIKNKWPVAIVITDSGGNIVLLHKLDNTQHISVQVAQNKAQTAVNARRPTKKLHDAISNGNLILLSVDNISLIEGGIPIIVDKKLIGAIGVSGVTPAQDAQVAQAGIDALLKK